MKDSSTESYAPTAPPPLGALIFPDVAPCCDFPNFFRKGSSVLFPAADGLSRSVFCGCFSADLAGCLLVVGGEGLDEDAGEFFLLERLGIAVAHTRHSQ